MSTQRAVTIILCFFLGGFNGQDFYLHNTARGVLGILFCWTAIPAIVSFIRGIIYLSWSDKQFFDRYPWMEMQ